jgi:hypothetical protein
MFVAIGIRYATLLIVTAAPSMLLNAVLLPRYRQPRTALAAATHSCALKGIRKRGLTRAHSRDHGIAPSRAKAQRTRSPSLAPRLQPSDTCHLRSLGGIARPELGQGCAEEALECRDEDEALNYRARPTSIDLSHDTETETCPGDGRGASHVYSNEASAFLCFWGHQ